MTKSSVSVPRSCSGRRRFIRNALASCALSMVPLSLRAAVASDRSGLQLYTLRDWMAVSVEGTLKMVAGVGYNEVEFAGYYGLSPKSVRTILEDEGLSAPSAHFSLDEFRSGVNQIIDAALEIGHRFVVLPYLTEAQRGTSIEVYKALSDELNKWGEICREQGITLAYHNHDFEFFETEGELPYEVLLQQTDARNVAMEMDLYWMYKARQDPVHYFRRYPKRFKLWHVKDMDKCGEFAAVGEGIIDFKHLFRHADLAGAEHYFVEMDQSQDELSAISTGYKGLSELLRR